MRIGLRALGLTGLLMVALYSGQPIHVLLLRLQSKYDQSQQQRNLVLVNSNYAAMKSALTVIMATVLLETPSFSRVRVAVIHNQIPTDPTTPLVYDSVAIHAAAGHSPGELLVNTPISQMSDYLGTLLKQECAYVPLDAISHPSIAARMRSLTIAAFLGCPILDEKGELLGVIYGTWEHLTDVPDDLGPTIKRLTASGRQIGTTIKLVY